MPNDVRILPLPDNGGDHPVSVELTVNASDVGQTIGDAQKTLTGTIPVIPTATIIMGWDGDEHREVAVDALGNFNVTTTVARLDVVQTHRRDYTASSVSGAYTTLFTTASAVQEISIFDSGGVTMVIGWDGNDHLLIPPGGIEAEFTILQGKDVQIKTAASGTVSTGEIVINLLG